MPTQMTMSGGIIETLVHVAPTFVLVCVVFIVFSWLRVLIDKMSGRGM